MSGWKARYAECYYWPRVSSTSLAPSPLSPLDSGLSACQVAAADGLDNLNSCHLRPPDRRHTETNKLIHLCCAHMTWAFRALPARLSFPIYRCALLSVSSYTQLSISQQVSI